MIRLVLLAAFAFLVSGAVASADAPAAMPPMKLPPQPKVRPAGMPANAVMVSPCVAHMGEHWIALKDAPIGPIYGTYQGKIIFTEIMITQKMLAQGFTYLNIRALPGHTIDHVDFEFEPHGHEGMPFPHYDVHAYYISPATVEAICPNGAPNPAWKPYQNP